VPAISQNVSATRVARWYIKKTWVYFGGPWNGKCLCILWPIGIFFPVLVYCTKKNLATLSETRKELQLIDLVLRFIIDLRITDRLSVDIQIA
jgi:hypothetical protein